MSGNIAPKKIGRGFERNLNAGVLQPMVGSFTCICGPAPTMFTRYTRHFESTWTKAEDWHP